MQTHDLENCWYVTDKNKNILLKRKLSPLPQTAQASGKHYTSLAIPLFNTLFPGMPSNFSILWHPLHKFIFLPKICLTREIVHTLYFYKFYQINLWKLYWVFVLLTLLLCDCEINKIKIVFQKLCFHSIRHKIQFQSLYSTDWKLLPHCWKLWILGIDCI